MQITLHPREGATMAPGQPVQVRCLAGVLWITNQCDSKDRVLKAGDSAELSATQRQYLSSVGRHEAVSFEVIGGAANVSVSRSGAMTTSAAMTTGAAPQGAGSGLATQLGRWLERGLARLAQARLAKA
jgi:hypothetical protein